MSQSRRLSLIETGVNIGAGYLIAIVTQIAVLPAFGLTLPLPDHLRIGAVFLIVSLARSYLVRRLFERLSMSRKAGAG